MMQPTAREVDSALREIAARSEPLPSEWREALGITEELEQLQPGHTLGCIVFYLTLAICAAALVYGMAVKP